MSKLEGKIALITGGNSGIGLATAKRFVDEGAYVFINGRREVELLSAAKDIGKNVKALKGDVSNLNSIALSRKSKKTKVSSTSCSPMLASYFSSASLFPIRLNRLGIFRPSPLLPLFR